MQLESQMKVCDMFVVITSPAFSKSILALLSRAQGQAYKAKHSTEEVTSVDTLMSHVHLILVTGYLRPLRHL